MRNVVVLMEGLMKRQDWCNGGSGRMGYAVLWEDRVDDDVKLIVK